MTALALHPPRLSSFLRGFMGRLFIPGDRIMAAGQRLILPSGKRGILASGKAAVKDAGDGCDPCCECIEGCPSTTDCTHCPGATPRRMRVVLAGQTNCPCTDCPDLTSYNVIGRASGTHDLVQDATDPCKWIKTVTGLSYRTFTLIGCAGVATVHTPVTTLTVTRTATGYKVEITGADGATQFLGETAVDCESDSTVVVNNTLSCSCTGPVIATGGTATITLCAPCPACSVCTSMASGRPSCGCRCSGYTPDTIVATGSGITMCDSDVIELSGAFLGPNCPSECSQFLFGSYNVNKSVVLKHGTSSSCTWSFVDVGALEVLNSGGSGSCEGGGTDGGECFIPLSLVSPESAFLNITWRLTINSASSATFSITASAPPGSNNNCFLCVSDCSQVLLGYRRINLIHYGVIFTKTFDPTSCNSFSSLSNEITSCPTITPEQVCPSCWDPDTGPVCTPSQRGGGHSGTIDLEACG